MPKGNPYKLPEKDRERLKRSEMACCKYIMLLTSDLHYAKDDIGERLSCVPLGKERMNMIVGGIDSLLTDLMGTVPHGQRRQLLNQSNDFVMKAVPKMSVGDGKVMVYLDDIKELVECARERCKICANTDEEARKCRLYKWLETNIPLDDYGDGLLCPYATEDWGD